MGTSNPNTIQLVLNVDMPQSITTNSAITESNDSAAAPLSSLKANAKAMDSSGKEIQVQIKINSQSNKSIERISENENCITNDNIKNIDNNIARKPDNNNNNNINNINNIDNNKKKKKEDNDNNINNSNNNSKSNNDELNNFSIFDKNNSSEFNKNNDNNIDINIPKNKDINDNKNINDIKNKNKENNFLKEGVQANTNPGKEEKKEEKVQILQTDEGKNIDNNLPNNKYEEKEILINNKTPVSENIDINQGSSYNKNNIEENKDNYLGINYSKGDLSLSQTFYQNKEESLGDSIQMMEKGFCTLFLKLNNNTPIFFHVKEEDTLKTLIQAYIQKFPETKKEIKNDIKLYNNKRSLDLNTPIKNLSLRPFCIITNKI